MFLLVKMLLIIYVLNTGKQPKLRNCFYGKTNVVFDITKPRIFLKKFEAKGLISIQELNICF